MTLPDFVALAGKQSVRSIVDLSTDGADRLLVRIMPRLPSLTDLFLDSVAEIEAEYGRLGHLRGWRFLTSPRNTLAANARVALLTLNPGGKDIDPMNGIGSCEAGSAYVHERWGNQGPGASPLQKQVRAMSAWLSLDPDVTLSAYFIPFRSPSYSELVAKQESFEFGCKLWRRIFREVQPTLVICLGNDVEKGLHSLWGHPLSVTEHTVGWEPQRAVLSRYPGKRVLLRLPHLSRFRVFGRAASAGSLRVIREELERQLA